MPTEVYHQSFSARIEALTAIKSRDADVAEIAADSMLSLGLIYGRYSPGAELVSFSVALSCLALQWKWVNAIRSAEPDADRFQRAAQLRAREHLQSTDDNPFNQIIAELAVVQTTEELSDIEKKLAAAQLPFAIKVPSRGSNLRGPSGKTEGQKKPEVAFVRFEINGDPAKTIDTLAPNMAHDMVLHLRVKNWPIEAERLIVEPVSAEPGDCYDLPKFVLDKPKDPAGPIVFEKSGRLILKMAQPIGAKPLEFKYRAVFDPKQSGFVDLLGHRTLKLESLDPTGIALSGYQGLDAKLIEVRKRLAMTPGLPGPDVSATMTLLASLSNLAGQALQSSLFCAGIREAEFQAETVRHLRSNPKIGSELEEHPHVGGGISDLSYRQIRLELKAQPSGALSEQKISKYADQTAQYVVATGKRVGVLCILDSRPKTKPPVPAESLLSIVFKHEGNATVPIVTLVVQGGLSKPSDLSR